MANIEYCKALELEVKRVLEYRTKSLVSRPEWGVFNFKNAEIDLERIYKLLAFLEVMPLEHLPDDIAVSMTRNLVQLRKHLEEINLFSIRSSDANKKNEDLVINVRRSIDTVYKDAAPWVAFLAYLKGDVTQNIERLSSAVTEANEMLEKAKADTQKKFEEIERIITTARETSAAAGAGVFTADFEEESKKQGERARPWLIATACLAVATLAVAVFTWFWTQIGLDKGQIWQKVSSKLIALSVLMTATFWCGKMYKALMHQSAVNRHRALSLRTFQAFLAAASDEQTKNAVLLETTRSIFSPGVTGFVDARGSGPESDSPRIIEIVKSLTKED